MNETTNDDALPTILMNLNTTDDYCGLEKEEMAERASLCTWPNTPPLCEETWFKYVGASTANISKVFYLVVFTVLFTLSVRMQVWSMQRLRAKKKGFFEKTGE